MGGKKSKTVEIHHVPDPTLIKQIEEQSRRIQEQHKLLEEEIRKNAAASEEAKKLKADLDKMATEQAEFKKQMEKERQVFENKIKEYYIQNSALTEELNKIKEELAKENINDLDDLPEAEDHRFQKILHLCSLLPKAPLQDGTHIGFIGCTSVGKSTLINKCIGKNVCATGRGEVTIEMMPYRKEHTRFVYWDMPGKNDKINYLSASYIGTMKSMSFIGIMVQNTTKEMAKIIELMEHLKIGFHIIVNQIDTVEDEELESFKTQIRKEMEGITFCKGIFFISAKKQLGDWTEFVDAVTNA